MAFDRSPHAGKASFWQPAALLVALICCVSLSAGGVVAGQTQPSVATHASNIVDRSAVTAVTIDSTDRTLIDRQAQHFTAADFEQENIQRLAAGSPVQQIGVELTVEGFSGTETLVINYSETASAGLELADLSVRDGPLAGAVTDTTVRPGQGTLTVEFDTSQTGDVRRETQLFSLEWRQTSQFSVPGNDSVLSHTVRLGGSGASGTYRLTERGATAIAPGDEQFDLDTGVDEETIDPTRDGETGAFSIWQEQLVTFQTTWNNGTLGLYEYETTEEGTVKRGEQITTLGNATGAVRNYDTGTLGAGRYIVDFNRTDGVAIIEVEPLNLQAEMVTDRVERDEPVEVDVSASDRSGGKITALFFDAATDTLVHSQTTRLDGDGTGTVSVDPETDLNGIDRYSVVVRHEESEVSTDSLFFAVVDTLQKQVTIASPQPVGDSFTRGDIVPIRLNFQNTDTGTVTVGSQSAGIEIDLTVRDADADGTGLVYLNTFQTGDGPVVHPETGNIVEADEVPELRVFDADGNRVRRAGRQGNPKTYRNHGFFTAPDGFGIELRGPTKQEAVADADSLGIGGGPGGGGVLPAGNYSLVSVAGSTPATAPGVTPDDQSLIRLHERTLGNVTLWTAPGVGDVAPTFRETDDIEAAREAGTLTPADGQIASGDLLVIELPVTGIEGLFHDAGIADERIKEPTEFLDRGEDHVLTEVFFATDAVGEQTGQRVIDAVLQQVNTTTGAVDGTLPLREHTRTVIGGVDDSGSLSTLYLVATFEAGDRLTDENGRLTPGETLRTNLTVSPLRETSVEPVFATGRTRSVSTRFLRPVARPAAVSGTVKVSPEPNVTVRGTTTVAAGTNLSITIETTPDNDSSVVKRYNATVSYRPDGPNSWELLGDFQNIENGTAFEMTIRRADGETLITPGGEPIPGLVTTDARPCIDVNGNGECATDTTGDGLLNDVGGDGQFSIADVQLYFQHRNDDVITGRTRFFDFKTDGRISIADVQVLFSSLVS